VNKNYPVPNTGRKPKLLPKRWLFRFAVDDVKGRPIPLFKSKRTNRKIDRMAEAIKKTLTKR
jgi:hypothetical protein